MDQILSYLPQDDGLLPKWLLLVSIIAMGNSIQSYVTTTLTKRVYMGRPDQTTELSSRTFGTWTFLSAVIRCYAAYNITNPQVYDICIWTYVIAAGHFMTEWKVYGTASFGQGLIGPLVVSSVSNVWMLTQRDAYLGL